MRRTERAAYRTKFYSNLSSPTQFDEEPLFSDLNGFFYLFIKIKFHFSMIQSIRPLLHDYVFGH